MALAKKLENQCDRQKLKLIRLENETEINVMESNQLKERENELEKTKKEEHQRCTDLRAKGVKVKKQLNQNLNQYANTKLDAHINATRWMAQLERNTDELKQMVDAAAIPDEDAKVEPGAKEAADSLVAKVKDLRKVISVKPDSRAEAEHMAELRNRCQSATDKLGPIAARETVLKQGIARNRISASLLERDHSCVESCLNGLRVAANKEAEQFAQYERQKAMLEQDLNGARKRETDNLYKAQQIKADAIIAKQEAKDKLYLGELEVQKLEDKLRETKNRTSEHEPEAELLQQWGFR
jgi:hypothetical protein